MFDLKQLRCFVAVAEELNFSRAAGVVNMTQSPFSRQIRMLEEGLGVQLLDRDSRKVQLTLPGLTFLSEARNILKATDMVVTAARQTAEGNRGSIALGFITSAGISLMPDIVARCRAHLPNISLILREMPYEQLVAALAEGALEVGLLWPSAARELSSLSMVIEPMVAALPPRDARLFKTSLTPYDFHDKPFVMYSPDSARYLHNTVRDLLKSEGSSPRIAQHLPNPHTILSMVANGFGAALVPHSATRLHFEGVRFCPLQCAGRDLVETHAVWNDDNSNPALRRFLQILSAMPKRSMTERIKPAFQTVA
jgi:DNA-binding transcriptional LysR family regulator